MTTTYRGDRHLALSALIAVAVATLLLATHAANAAAALSTTVVADDVGSGPIAPGPDGAMWTLQRTDVSRFELARYSAGGELSHVSIARPLDDVRSDLVSLDDGGMGIIVARQDIEHPAASFVALARFGPNGTSARLSRLPVVGGTVRAFAIEQDGTVWFARLCKGALYRWHAASGLERFPLPRGDRGCSPRWEENPITVGPDGSVWVADIEYDGGRILQRDLSGRTRTWPVPISDTRGYPAGVELVADPRGGGVAYGGSWFGGNFAGRVTPEGRLVVSRVPGLVSYAPDGTLWRLRSGGIYGGTAGAIERTTPRGVTTRVNLPDTTQPFALAVGRDAVPWTLVGRFFAPPSIEGSFSQLGFGAVEALRGGPGQQPAVIPVRSFEATGFAPFVLGGDGAFWTYLDKPFPSYRQALVRALPSGLRQPRAAVAAPHDVRGRTGRTIALQLSCSAEAGRYCRGTVRLAGATRAARFVVAGAGRAVVRLTLQRYVVRELRQGGAVRSTAIVRGGGRIVRRDLTLR